MEMESAEENQRISCRVTQLHNVIKPHDNMFPWYMFSLDISTTFLNYSDRSVFLVERSKVLDDNTSRSNLRDILLEMNVPDSADYHVFIIDRVLESAISMAGEESLWSRRILRLSVEIDVRVSLEDIEEDPDVLNRVMLIPASESSIEALEKVSVENEHECVICLEEVLKVGCRGIQLPCSHVYHDTCIRVWLKCNGVCPLCRFRIVC